LRELRELEAHRREPSAEGLAGATTLSRRSASSGRRARAEIAIPHERRENAYGYALEFFVNG